MKTKKLIRNALAVLTIVFMSAVLCGAGCSNAADSPSAPTSLDAAAILRQYPAWYEADVRISTNKLSGIGKHRFENGKVFFVDGKGQICNYTTSGSSVIITFTDGTIDSIDFSMLVDCDKLPNTDENGGVVTHNKAGCKMLYFGDNGSGEIVSWHSHEIK